MHIWACNSVPKMCIAQQKVYNGQHQNLGQGNGQLGKKEACGTLVLPAIGTLCLFTIFPLHIASSPLRHHLPEHTSPYCGSSLSILQKSRGSLHSREGHPKPHRYTHNPKQWVSIGYLWRYFVLFCSHEIHWTGMLQIGFLVSLESPLRWAWFHDL